MQNEIQQLKDNIHNYDYHNPIDFKSYFVCGKDGDGNKTKPKKEEGRELLANHFVKDFNCISVGKEKKVIYRYVDGIYIEAMSFVKCKIQEYLGSYSNIGNINEVVDKIKNLKDVERSNFDNTNKNLICLNNGIYDINENKLTEHDPNIYFFKKININYNVEAMPDKTIKVFEELLNNKNVTILQEWVGFSIYRQYFIKKALIMTGAKNTGKTTVLNIITNFIGIDNVSGVSLHDIIGNRFTLSNLYNNFINIYDELSASDVNDTGRFKMLTGQSQINGAVKFRDDFNFVNYSKLTFACNKIPAVNDVDDEAYFDRWIIMNFGNELNKSEVDPFLMDKLNTEVEKSGLFNWALVGLKRLLDKKSFSYSLTPEEIKIEMLKNSNPLAGFVYNKIGKVEDQNNNYYYIMVNELYKLYYKYCDDNNLNIENDDYFYKNIRRYAPFLTNFRKSFATENGPEQKWCYGNFILLGNDTK